MSIEGEVRVLINKLVFEGTMDTWEEDLNHTLSAILKLTNLKPLDNREMLVYLIPWEPFIHQCKNTSPIELTEKLADGICSHFSKPQIKYPEKKGCFCKSYKVEVVNNKSICRDCGKEKSLEFTIRNKTISDMRKLNGEGGV